MTDLEKQKKEILLANCNLVLMAILYVISLILGSLGTLIVSAGYGIYYKYWKPTIYMIPAFLFILMIIFIVAFSLTEFISEDQMKALGWLLSIFPAAISFNTFRQRIIQLKVRHSKVE